MQVGRALPAQSAWTVEVVGVKTHARSGQVQRRVSE